KNDKVAGTFANSIVSSMMLEQIACAEKLKYENTLTGFKWVSRVKDLRYGYEEALGYCVDPQSVSDKDGISAALMFLELVAHLQTEGKSPWDVLNELALLHGLHATDQVSVRVTDLSQVATVMTQLRTNPPKTMGGLKVDQIDDLSEGFAGLPKTDAVIIHLGGSSEIEKARVIIRPSGTEPKIKCYLEVVVRNSDLAIARVRADNELQELARDAQPLLAGGK
ncbi:MAG: phospho-sugar mutase, partial [Actinomycetes bacterium]